MRKHKVVAVEGANGMIKGFCEGKQIVYPNTINTAPKLTEPIKKVSRHPVFVYEGEAYQVGRVVKGYRYSTSTDYERYESDEFIKGVIFAIAQLVENGDEIILSTDIPANHFDWFEEASKRLYRQFKNRKFTVEVNGEIKTFTILDVDITLQGLSSFFNFVMDENGVEIPENVKQCEESKTLVIDIGWGSVDLVEIFGLDEIIDWKTLSVSMRTAYRNMKAGIIDLAKSQNKRLASDVTEELEVESQLRRENIYRSGAYKLDATEIKETELKKLAQQILTEVNSSFPIIDYQTVLFTGGGTSNLWKYIEPHVTDQATGEWYENIFVMEDCQLANAKGCYIYSKYLYNM